MGTSLASANMTFTIPLRPAQTMVGLQEIPGRLLNAFARRSARRLNDSMILHEEEVRKHMSISLKKREKEMHIYIRT